MTKPLDLAILKHDNEIRRLGWRRRRIWGITEEERERALDLDCQIAEAHGARSILAAERQAQADAARAERNARLRGQRVSRARNVPEPVAGTAPVLGPQLVVIAATVAILALLLAVL